MIPGLSYILTAMVAGVLVDTFGSSSTPRQEYKLKLTSTAGFVLLAASYFMIAPAFARGTLQRLAFFVPSLVVLGIGVGFTILPTVSDLQSIAERRLGEDDESVSSKVSGVWGCAYGLGGALGPIVGGALDSAVGINWGSFIFSVVMLLAAGFMGYGAWTAKDVRHRAVD